MKKSKVFLIISAIFFLILLWIAYDIATRTRFPGSERLDSLQHTDHLSDSLSDTKDTVILNK